MAARKPVDAAATLPWRPLVRSLLADILAALESGPARAYLAAELVATSYLVARRGPGVLLPVAVIGAGAIAFGVVAWFSGRSTAARPSPDLVRAPRAETAVIAVGYAGLSGWFLGWWPPGPWPSASTVFQAALAAWLAIATVAWIRAARAGLATVPELAWVTRDWRPFVPLFLAIVIPKLPGSGLGLVGGTWHGLSSGVVQQFLLQVGVTARLEAVLGRADAAAVLGAVAFGAVHVAINLPQAGGDWWIAAANAMILQTTIGLVFCIAFLRHRAPLPLGLCHALLQAS